MLNGTLATWVKISLAFALGLGAAVASTYTTFESRGDHNLDIRQILDQRQNDRDELFETLRRMEDKIDALRGPHVRVPEQPYMPREGWDNPPLQRKKV